MVIVSLILFMAAWLILIFVFYYDSYIFVLNLNAVSVCCHFIYWVSFLFIYNVFSQIFFNFCFIYKERFLFFTLITDVITHQ